MRPKLNSLLRTCVAALMLVSLSACWQSERSLVRPANSVNPLPSGTYSYFTGDSTIEPDDILLIAFPDGGYVYYNKIEDSALPLLIHRIDNDWHILQLGNDDNANVFGIARRVGDKIEIYDPDCGDYFDGIEGLVSRGIHCEFSTLEALVEATKAAMPHIESGEFGSPNGWFRPQDVERLN